MFSRYIMRGLVLCIIFLLMQSGLGDEEASGNRRGGRGNGNLRQSGRDKPCRQNKCRRPSKRLETNEYCRRYVVYRRCQTDAMKKCSNQKAVNNWVSKKEDVQEISCYMHSEYYIVYVGHLKPKRKFDITFVDCQQYNLVRKYKNKGALSKIIYGMTRSFWTAIPQDVPDREPGFEVTKLNCSEFAVKFRIYVNITGVPGQVENDDIMESLEMSLQRKWADYLHPQIPGGFDIALNQVVCPATVMTYEPSGKKATFPKTMINQVAKSKEVCRSGGVLLHEARMKCTGDIINGAKWGTVKWTHKCIVTKTTKSTVTEKLQGLLKTNNGKTTMMDIWKLSRDLEILVKEPDILVSNDITYIANVLDKIVEVNNIPTTISEKVISVISKVIKADNPAITEAEDMSAAASRIIKAKDKILLNTRLNGKTHWNHTKDNMKVEVWEFSVPSNYVVGLMLKQAEEPNPLLSDDSDEDTSYTSNQQRTLSLHSNTRLNVPESEAAIILPSSIIDHHVKSRSRSGPVRLIMDVFTDTSLFNHQASGDITGRADSVTQYLLNSKVISATLAIGNRIITNLDGQFVKTVFLPKVTKNNTPLCVYWNTTGQYGEWSTEGCYYNRTIGGRYTCQCNHLTNFAILMDFGGQTGISKEHTLALTIITYVGLCVSIGLISLTILSFILIKKLRTGRSQQTLLNLCVSLLCSWVVFIVGIDRTESYIACIVVAVMLHYFILVTFMWMLVEGFLQYLRFVTVLGTYFPKFVLKAALIAWGGPLIPVIITISMDYKLYKGGDTYCWMSLGAFYYSFACPVGAIMLINIILYIIIMWKIFNRPKGLQSNQDTSKTRMLGVKAAVSVFVLLGLTWVFGYFTIDDGRMVFSYIFTVLNVFQGLYIFILFVVRDVQFRDYWTYVCCNRCKGPYPIRGISTKTSSTSTTSLTSRKASKTRQSIF